MNKLKQEAFILLAKPWLFLSLALVLLLGVSFNSRLNDRNWRYVMNSDGKGYYAFLPAIFIYGDLSFPFVEDYEKDYYDPGNFSEFRMGAGNHIVNKYWCGVSVMMSPFFFCGLVWAYLGGFEIDGYDFPFQASIAFGAIFWLLLGIFLLHKCLVHEWKILPHFASFAVLFMVFATNLFYYTVFEPSMSHVYSFTAIAAWIWSFYYLRSNQNVKGALLFGSLLGLIALIRPTNLIVVLSLPFLAGGISNLKAFLLNFLRSKKNLILTLSGFFVLFGIQPFIFFLQTGKVWAYTYGNEGFNFLKPEIINLLFSFRKGLFVYAPLCFVALSGLFFMKARQATWSFVFLLLVFYLLSSWWMWYYGGSYGMRAAIDFFPFFTILLALAINRWPLIFIMLSILCTSYTIVQTYQYTHWILPYDGMNKEKFMMIFMKTDDEYIGKIKAE